MSFEKWELPSSWAWTAFGEIAEVIGGGTPSTKEPDNFDGDIPWITPADMSHHTGKLIAHGSRSITSKGLEGSGARWLPAGTVLFSSRAPIGYTAIAAQPITTNQGFKSFVLGDGISSDYSYYWLIGAKQIAEELASGTTFLELSGAKAALLPIPVAPRAEQARIVEKLESLLADLDAGVTELKAAQRKLARYRQSLLKAAVEGALTAEWREANVPQETGAQLLQRILRERRARFEQKYGGKKKYKEPAAPDASQLPALPQGWVWATVEQLAELVSGHTPKDAGKFSNSAGSVHWFKVADMNADGNEDSLVVAATRFTEGTANELGLKIAPTGTIVFPKRGGAIATNKKRRLGVEGAYDLNMMGLVVVPVAAEWLWSWFKGIDLAKLSDGSNVPQINNPDIAPLLVPLPPLEEQHQITAYLDAALSACKDQEHAMAHALKQAAAQRRNLLRAAFSGQLAAQDPADEPASALLARIRAERADGAGKTKRQRIKRIAK